MAVDFNPSAMLQEVEQFTERLLKKAKRKEMVKKVMASSVELMPYLVLQQHYINKSRKPKD